MARKGNTGNPARVVSTRSAERTCRKASSANQKSRPIGVMSSSATPSATPSAAERSRENFALRKMRLDLEERQFELDESNKLFREMAKAYREKYGLDFSSHPAE
jgi:hypothetical protein